MSNSSIWSIDGTLSGATTPGQSESGSDGNERILCIPQSSSIVEASPADCLLSYPGHLSVGDGLTHPVKMQLVYSTAAAVWAKNLRANVTSVLNYQMTCQISGTGASPSDAI